MTKPSIQEQEDVIIRLMANGEWRGAASSRELAAKWEVHPRTVGDRAVVASGFLKRTGGDLEGWVMSKLAELEHIAALALAATKPVVVDGVIELVKAPDTKAATAAVKLQLELRGQLVKKVEKIDKGELEGLSQQELVTRLEEALQAEKANLPEVH